MGRYSGVELQRGHLALTIYAGHIRDEMDTQLVPPWILTSGSNEHLLVMRVNSSNHLINCAIHQSLSELQVGQFA